MMAQALMGRGAWRSALVLATVAATLAACAGGASQEETAPPPTPLPSLRTASRSDAPSEVAETARSATPDPESAYRQLLASVPGTIRVRCARGEAGRRELARVTCEPSPGAADSVTYSLFEGVEAMDAALRAITDDRPNGATDGAACDRGPGEERLAVGRKVCYRAADGTAVVAWTNDLASILGQARRSDGDFARLDAFWETAGPITP